MITYILLIIVYIFIGIFLFNTTYDLGDNYKYKDEDIFEILFWLPILIILLIFIPFRFINTSAKWCAKKIRRIKWKKLKK